MADELEIADDSATETTETTDAVDPTTVETDATDPGEHSAEIPESYSEFTLPEGMELDSTTLEQASPLFKELGLPQDKAQKVVDFYAKMRQDEAQGLNDAHATRVTDWEKAAEADQEIGGDKFQENVSVAQRAVEKFGTPELKELLTTYGLGSHPEVVRAFFKIGKLTLEDDPGSASRAANNGGGIVDRLYGKN